VLSEKVKPRTREKLLMEGLAIQSKNVPRGSSRAAFHLWALIKVPDS